MEVQSLKDAFEIAKNDENVFGYYVETQKYIVDGSETYWGRRKRIKNVIFGKVYTIDEMRQMHVNENTLRAAESDGKAIKIRIGYWIGFEKSLKVIEL